MKKALAAGLIILSTVLAISSVTVQAETFTPPFRGEFRNIFNGATGSTGDEGSLSITPRQFGEEVRENVLSGTPAVGIFNRIKNFIKKNFKFGARIQGTILSIGVNVLSIKGNDGKTYQVNISSTTNLIRLFGGKSSLSEFSVGDKIMVFGKFTDDTDLAINANTIKNLSIQKRWGTFFGKVAVKNGNNFVMDTLERGTQTVYFGSAKFVERNEKPMTYADLKVGHRVRVKGVWDKTLNQIKEVTQVKDFSLPVVEPSKVPSPTPTTAVTTPTPTVAVPTPTPTGTI